MSEIWREWLYPLGFISSLAFTARFLLQWLSSEKKKQSVVTPLFWKISLVGNCFLWIHSIIQIQLHVALIQTFNAIISWRNLNLMQTYSKPISIHLVFVFLIAGISLTLGLFCMQTGWENASLEGWLRNPSWIGYSSKDSIVWGWHLAGFSGLILFNSRFWVQWWLVEKYQISYLSPLFWWMSLAGDILCLIYFVFLGDVVNLIGPAFGLLPYVRNLMLIYKISNSNPSEIQS